MCYFPLATQPTRVRRGPPLAATRTARRSKPLSKEISPLAVVGALFLGTTLCAVGAFALFMSAMGERWWPALTFMVVGGASSLAAGFLLGRHSRANGWAGVAALVAPSLLLALFFLTDLLRYFLTEPAEPGVPAAGLAFLALSLLFCLPAVAGVGLAKRRRP